MTNGLCSSFSTFWIPFKVIWTPMRYLKKFWTKCGTSTSLLKLSSTFKFCFSLIELEYLFSCLNSKVTSRFCISLEVSYHTELLYWVLHSTKNYISISFFSFPDFKFFSVTLWKFYFKLLSSTGNVFQICVHSMLQKCQIITIDVNK